MVSGFQKFSFLYIHILHKDCSHIEDVYLLFCGHLNIFWNVELGHLYVYTTFAVLTL